MGRIQEFCVNARAPKSQNTCFFVENQLSLQKGTDIHVQFHQSKKSLQGIKNKIQGIGPCFD